MKNLENFFIADENIGIYIAPNVKVEIDEIKNLYRNEFGLRLLDSKEIFWGPYLKRLPNLTVDYKSLNRSYGLINEPVLKKILMVSGRDHYPNGLLIITSKMESIRRTNIKLVRPWDIGATILALITNLLPADMDGSCIPILGCYAKRMPLTKILCS